MTTKFFKCTICGNVIVKLVDSGVIPVCCGKEMVELKPGTTDGKVEYHVPVSECAGNSTINVKVGEQPHPMTNEHHIEFIYLETENGGMICFLDPTGQASATFCGCNDMAVAVYAYCNLHGLWRSDIG
ncbi:MAG: desulfoferrodoxin [Bacteroidaceae bacterium]|nr:desulfoferrodoxin [Bacteroidaceae bacterium]